MKRENTTLSRKQNYKYFKNTYTHSFFLSSVMLLLLLQQFYYEFHLRLCCSNSSKYFSISFHIINNFFHGIFKIILYQVVLAADQWSATHFFSSVFKDFWMISVMDLIVQLQFSVIQSPEEFIQFSWNRSKCPTYLDVNQIYIVSLFFGMSYLYSPGFPTVSK